MADTANNNPELGALFRIEIDGIQIASFETCTGLKSKWTRDKYRSGTDGLYKKNYTGMEEFDDIQLGKQVREGGVVDNKLFWDWKRAGSSDKRSMSIVNLSRKLVEIRRFNLTGVFVGDIEASDLDAENDNEKLIDTITLVLDYGEEVS